MSGKKTVSGVVERIKREALAEEKATVLLDFSGVGAEEMARRFFTYLVDGGLEDHLIQNLSGNGITLEIGGCEVEALVVTFQCSSEKRSPLKTRKGDIF